MTDNEFADHYPTTREEAEANLVEAILEDNQEAVAYWTAILETADHS